VRIDERDDGTMVEMRGIWRLREPYIVLRIIGLGHESRPTGFHSTRSVLLRLKCARFVFARGLAARPTGGAHNVLVVS